MWAAGRDNGDAVHALIAGGAKPDAISNVINLPNAKVDFSFAVATALPRGGMTALMYAAREGQLNGVTALADAGANLNVADPEVRPQSSLQ
jgi:ankyrin repeat protein